MARTFMRICNSKTFNPLPPTEFLGECHQPTKQTLMKILEGAGKSLGWVSGGKTHFFWLFNVFKVIKWVTMALKTIFMA